MGSATMQEIEVRLAVPADVGPLSPLFDAYRQMFGRPADLAGSRAFLQDRLTQGDATILLALAGGQYLGFIQLYPSYSSLFTSRVFILNDFYVAPAARQQGVGGRLLEAVAAHAQAHQAARVTLSTLCENNDAQRLYRRHGWCPDERFTVFHRGF